MHVMIGNGSTIECNTRFPSIPITIQGFSFVVDLFQLPIGGADIVLGVQWLKTLGPVTIITFLGQSISLNADVPLLPNPASAQQLKRLAQTHCISVVYHLTHVPAPQPNLPVYPSPTPPTPPLTKVHPPLLAHLLQHYSTLFQEPNQLPPPHTITHLIHLLPNSSPVNVRPYRYPYPQKNELERQVTAMLEADLIRPSHSMFSSLVLLVKKKDGSWHCCVDYRALNAITIKDRFPMPTVDELLDEIGKASWFSKLDLRQGFHQIRMHEDDIPKTVFRTHHGHYEFKVMPFGLTNAPSTFQETMNELLQPFLHKFFAVLFDNILVYSPSFATHLDHLEAVFTSLVH